jgi:hypothetical protein
VGCGTIPAPNSAHRELAAKLEGETVALVRLINSDGDEDENGHPALFCAGVWISPRSFLTAGHCIEHAGEPNSQLNRLLQSLGASVPQWDPIGQPTLFATNVDLPSGYWTAKVTGFSKALDLGLVTVNAPGPINHPFAYVGLDEIDDGDRVEIVGHPTGHAWSYAEGVVAASLPDEPNADETPMPTLMVAGPFSHGNSGGGVFDAQGGLIGIGSYISQSTNGMGFCVHRDALLQFLVAAGEA